MKHTHYFRSAILNQDSRTWRASWLAVLLVCCISPVQSQESAEKSDKVKPEKLFASEEPMNITLYGPWSEITKNEKNQNPYEASIEFTDSLGQSQKLPLTVGRRGITRQTVCKHPPIKLRFDKEQVKGSTFRGQKSVKLVTHCDKGTRWEQYYVKEMIAYRMYNVITDLSFRVRPWSITYIDNKKKSKPRTHFGFVIEDDSDLAKRNDLKKLDMLRVNHTRLDALEMTRFSLFQYMIANVDWSALKGPGLEKCCHNAKLIGDPEAEKIYSIPYDFDSSGMVDADYAAPNPALPISKVTQRLYRGYCVNNPHLQPVREEFLASKQTILDLIRNEPLLSKSSIKSTLRYMDKFFATLESDKKFDKSITGKCRK